MNGRNDRYAYGKLEIQRGKLLRCARQEHALREAIRRSPSTASAYRAALLNLLADLFR